MKTICLSLLVSISLLAQAPPSKKGTVKEPPRGPGVKPSLMNPSSLHAQAPAVYKAQFTTTKGDFIIEVHREWAPIGADRFYNLVKYGFYNDASFFRVLKGFVAQFGMNAKPSVQAVWQNANLRDEPVKQSNKRGTVTFAKTSMPNTRSTQIFINLGDNGQLDADGFAAFGTVIEGMDVVDKFYNGYTDRNGPDQGRIAAEGKPYLDKNFSQLDSIKIAKIVVPAAPAPAGDAKKAAAPDAKKAAAPDKK
jgi:peptidyl-prolyl cis-trans isomerase A (cyclophilin A)